MSGEPEQGHDQHPPEARHRGVPAQGARQVSGEVAGLGAAASQGREGHGANAIEEMRLRLHGSGPVGVVVAQEPAQFLVRGHELDQGVAVVRGRKPARVELRDQILLIAMPALVKDSVHRGVAIPEGFGIDEHGPISAVEGEDASLLGRKIEGRHAGLGKPVGLAEKAAQGLERPELLALRQAPPLPVGLDELGIG